MGWWTIPYVVFHIGFTSIKTFFAVEPVSPRSYFSGSLKSDKRCKQKPVREKNNCWPKTRNISENPFNYDENDLGETLPCVILYRSTTDCSFPSFLLRFRQILFGDSTRASWDYSGKCTLVPKFPKRIVHTIWQHPNPSPHSYVFTAFNQPFAPSDNRTAEEILNDINHEYHTHTCHMDPIRRTLLKNWKQVQQMTHKHHHHHHHRH